MGALIPVVSRSAGITQFVAGNQFPAVSFKKALSDAGKVATAACRAQVFLQACDHDGLNVVVPPWVSIIGFVRESTRILGDLTFDQPTNSTVRGVKIITQSPGINCVRLNNLGASNCRVLLTDCLFESEDAANARAHAGVNNQLEVEDSQGTGRGTSNNPSNSALIEAVAGSILEVLRCRLEATDFTNFNTIDSQAASTFLRDNTLNGPVITAGVCCAYRNSYQPFGVRVAHKHNGTFLTDVNSVILSAGPTVYDTDTASQIFVNNPTLIAGSLNGIFGSTVDVQSLPALLNEIVRHFEVITVSRTLSALGNRRAFRFSGTGRDLVLPTGSGVYDGMRFFMMNQLGATLNTITRGGTDTINGSVSAHTLVAERNFVWLEYDKTNGDWSIISGGTDVAAIHKNAASEISTITEKTSPTGADLLVIEDSAAGNVKKRILVANLPGSSGLRFQGNWNAATNTPALASGVGSQGDFYIVSVDGSTNLDGIVDWKVNDWPVFNGTAWVKVDNTDVLTEIVQDTTPQLGGDLDTNGKTVNVITATAIGGGSAAALRAVSTVPSVEIRETDAALDEKSWDFLAQGGILLCRAIDDANSAGMIWMQIERTGDSVDSVEFPNGNVGVGGAPDASAQLDVASTTKGFLPPRMTSAQRDAISSPASGLSVYDLTNAALNFFNGAAWRALLNTPASTLTPGSLLFADGPAEAKDDNSNLFWDNTTKQLGIGTNAPAANAAVEISSTTRGLLPPRWTSAQETTNIASMGVNDDGMIWRNTTAKRHKSWDGANVAVMANEEDVVTVAIESFASTNARFFGELGLPAGQGFVDTPTGSATIDLLNETVFGELKQVVRHNDNVADGSTTSSLVLTAQNWTDIDNFGASYSGIARLDSANGALGFFSGLQANSAENPLATGNRRYGINFVDSGGNLQVSDADAGGSTVIFDGTGGNPQIDFDEYFSWEVVVPAGLGAAQFYINGVLTTFAPIFLTNTGGLGTSVRISSGSTGGVSRVTYHSSFGVTIYEESDTKTLQAATMAADVALVFIPEGKRDYTVILPDGNPRPVSAKLEIVAQNLLGKLTLVTENQSAPEALFNGLRKLILDIAFKEIVSGINAISNGNVYIGFEASDPPRLAQLSSSVDQIPGDTNPVVITFNTQDEISGITHSTTVNPGEITIVKAGIYQILVQPQVGQTGGTVVDMNIFLQRDTGSGFVDVPNSNVILTLKDADLTDVIVLGEAHVYQAGEKLRCMQKISAFGSGIGLMATAAQVGPPTVPATPSVIFMMVRMAGRV